MSALRLVHKIEAACIALATGGAVSGLHDVRPLGLPVDRAGMYADLGAGGFALAHWVRGRLARRRGDAAADH